MLVLRTERHEHGAEERKRNADEDGGVAEHPDEFVGQLVDRQFRHDHPSTLTAPVDR